VDASAQQYDRVSLREIGMAVGRTVVVTSSADGFDTDVLCRAPERSAVQVLLQNRGYRLRGPRLPSRSWTEQWVRFDREGVSVVDLNPAERWGLPSQVVDALFDQAHSLPEATGVAVPSPSHGLILLARRFGRSRGPLSDKQRRKVDRYVAASPHAWEDAAAIASEWDCAVGLQVLRDRFEGRVPSRMKPLRATVEQAARSTDRRGRLRSMIHGFSVSRRPFVVGLSGVDGAGKSTQIERLRTALDTVGVETTVAWRPVGHGRALRMVRKSAKRALALTGRSGSSPSPDSGEPAAPALTWDPNPATRQLRERSAALTAAWAAYVAVSTATPYRLSLLRARAKGAAVICDRGELDLVAHLIFQYGVARRPRLAIALATALFPPCDASFYLDIGSATAVERKPLQYTEAEVERLLRIYRSERIRLGVRQLDGERSADDLAVTIAREVWQATSA
jgi:thymidylate kinase